MEKSVTEVRFFPLGYRLLAGCAALGQPLQARLAILHARRMRLRGGALVQNLPNSASPHPMENSAPS
jgi:hypothetical protein